MEGWVKLYRLTRGGDEALIDVLGAGLCITDPRALDGARHALSCETCAECRIVLLDPGAVRACPEARAALADAVLRLRDGQMERMIRQLERLKLMSASQRLATFLLETGRFLGQPVEFILPYDKHLLAAHLGMKPESLSRAFGRLRAFGVTGAQKQVRISDVGALRAHCLQEAEVLAAA